MLKQKQLLIIFYLLMLFLFTNYCTTQNELKEQKQVVLNKNKIIPLAPGTTEVSCRLLDVIDHNDLTICKIKIETVHGYGPATRPLAVGSEISANISNNLMAKSGGRTYLEKYIDSDELLKITLSFQQNMKLGKAKTNSWSIIKFTN